MKDLTTVKQGKAATVQNRAGKCLKEEREILNRWTEYCTITRPVEIHQCWTVPRKTQRMTTPSFAKKRRLQYNQWRKGSRLESCLAVDLYLWRYHAQGRLLWQKCILRHTPIFFCSLVKKEQLWLRYEEITFEANGYLCCLRVDRATAKACRWKCL